MPIFPLTNASQALSLASQKPVAAGVQFSLDRLTAFQNSVDFKLRCAEFYLEQLRELLQDFPFTSFRRGPNLFRVNLHLDGLLTAAVSASDVFGRELNVYFGEPVTQPRFYLFDVLTSLQTARRCPTLVTQLMPHVDYSAQPLGLIPTLKRYRNCSMHTRLIDTATLFSATLTYADQQTGTTPLARPICYLPDDPTAFPCTYAQQIEAVKFCERSLLDLAALLDASYGIITAQLAAAASLPL